MSMETNVSTSNIQSITENTCVNGMWQLGFKKKSSESIKGIWSQCYLTFLICFMDQWAMGSYLIKQGVTLFKNKDFGGRTEK